MIVIWKACATLFWKCQTQILVVHIWSWQRKTVYKMKCWRVWQTKEPDNFTVHRQGQVYPISWKIHPIGKLATSRVHQESPKNHWSMPKYKASPVFVWDMLLCVYEYVDIYICRCVCLFPICLLLASPYLWHVGALVIHGLGASHQLYNGEIQNTHQLNNRKM